jgi:hypothetical protein
LGVPAACVVPSSGLGLGPSIPDSGSLLDIIRLRSGRQPGTCLLRLTGEREEALCGCGLYGHGAQDVRKCDAGLQARMAF